jgi:hypothetical protein
MDQFSRAQAGIKRPLMDGHSVRVKSLLRGEQDQSVQRAGIPVSKIAFGILRSTAEDAA